MYDSHIRPTGPMVTEAQLIVRMYVYDYEYGSRCASASPQSIFSNGIVSQALHEKAALWVMGAGPGEDHQGTRTTGRRRAQDLTRLPSKEANCLSRVYSYIYSSYKVYLALILSVTCLN